MLRNMDFPIQETTKTVLYYSNFSFILDCVKTFVNDELDDDEQIND